MAAADNSLDVAPLRMLALLFSYHLFDTMAFELGVPLAGEHSTDTATMMLDTLQHHPKEEPRELLEASPKQSSYVYPLVLVVGCVMVFAWRNSALPRFSWNRRRLYPSRYEV